MAGPLIWIALYYGWPALSRRLPLPESWKVKAQSDAASSAPKPGFWRLLGRGALAMLGIVTVMMLLTGMIMAPIGHSMGPARKVHDSIRVGMTVRRCLMRLGIATFLVRPPNLQASCCRYLLISCPALLFRSWV